MRSSNGLTQYNLTNNNGAPSMGQMLVTPKVLWQVLSEEWAWCSQSGNCTFYRRNWVLLTNTNPRETKVFTGVPGRHPKLSVPNTGPLVFGWFPSTQACLTCCPDSSMITHGFVSHISGLSPCLMFSILHDNPCNFPDVCFCAAPRQPP